MSVCPRPSRSIAGAVAAALLATAAVAQAPVPTPPANAPDQQPAFAEQTRAPQVKSGVTMKVQPLVRGLQHPWAVAPLPDGSALVTERPGRLRLYRPDGTLSDAIKGLPPVDARGQGGLLDVTLAPDFAQSRTIFWSYAEPRDDGANGTAVARGRLSNDGTQVEDVAVIFRQQPGWRSTMHFGSRIVAAPDGTLFITLGERSKPEPRALAQDPMNHLGKLIRITATGAVPADNPFASGKSALPQIYAMGFRNVQAAALDGQGRLWMVEHGPRGGDELNRPQAGRNYGWPIITYGIDYSGAPIGAGLTAQQGLEQPVYYWDPVIAPSGAAFVTGPAARLFPSLAGDLLVGAMKPPALVRLRLNGDRVTQEERFDLGIGRVRDVSVAADGAIWVVTDKENGGLYRLTPG